MARYYYYQEKGGEESWKPCPVSQRSALEADKAPAYFTVLAVSQLADELSGEDRDKLKYSGPLYFDWDGENIQAIAESVEQLCVMLQQKGLDLDCVSLYATGGRGFHLEIPMGCFIEKPPKDGIQFLPVIYKQLAFEVAVDYLDFRVYSGGRGRMWRTCGVKRDNGHYKVPITFAELQQMTPELYSHLTAEPRVLPDPSPPKLCLDMVIMFDHAQQAVADKLKKRKKKSTDPNILRKQNLPSLTALLEGRGIKEGTGFHQIALQLAVVADAMAWTEEQLIEKAQGLCEKHSGDGNRYNSEGKRRDELVRMHRYMADNPCYSFSIGGVKSLLNHEAPDLDGIPVSQEDVDKTIKAADEAPKDKTGDPEALLDEYEDVASSVRLSKFGVYANTEDGSKRICALSFEDVHILRSVQTGQVACYEATVLINGKAVGRQTLELDVFAGLQPFNKFASRHSHALLGTDQHVRSLMMQVASKGKREGKTFFVLNREGLDLVNVANHEDPEMREPFMAWADGKGVILEPRIAAKGYEFSFQGFPDPRGLMRTDISDAPELAEWIEQPGNRQVLREFLQNFIGCQQPNVIAKLLGWYTATFYRMLFNKVYSKFPILHVNGAAGAGKCLAKGTQVLLANGRTKAVEDVRIGDLLMGPDSHPREVLSLARGREIMYKVTQKRGDSYTVNASHNLSLLNTAGKTVTLPDGTRVAAGEKAKINVQAYHEASNYVRRSLQGWNAGAIEFYGKQPEPLLDPYWLGAWLGDGRSTVPTLCKPACEMTRWWVAHAEERGCEVTEGWSGTCQTWAIRGGKQGNVFTRGLREYGLECNKHIPADYLYGSLETRRRLLAGLIDSDGNVNGPGYRWATADAFLAPKVVFLARSLGLAATLREATYWHKQLKRDHTTWEVFITGDVHTLPCLDKKAKAPARNWRGGHGIEVERLDEGEYFGFQLDGDHLFLLGDFTPTFNTEMNKMLMSLYYLNQEPKLLTPGSTLFALQQHMSSSASIPQILDEYKPHEMPVELHGKLKLAIRDAYNCRDVSRGGGTRDSDDYRALDSKQLSAPLVVIAEAAEQEAAVMERVVLCTVVRPPASVAMKWSSRFHLAERSKQVLSIMGQYMANDIVVGYGLPQLQAEFDALLEEAQQKYMLNEADLKKGLSQEELQAKQGAKERTVYNYTVARFGLRKMRQLVKEIYADEFEATFAELEGAVYERMADLLPSTQAEWVKVFNTIAAMSVSVDPASPISIRNGYEYAFLQHHGRDAIELSARTAYHRYRAYCKGISERPLFPGDHAFLHGLKDCSALLSGPGPGVELKVPGGSFIFDLDELSRLGVEPFKDR